MNASASLTGLHVLADLSDRWKHDARAQAKAACEGGAAVVQLRAKDARDADALGLAREIRALTRDAGVLFFVNDRVDLALAADADGVHLGQGDLPPDRIPASARARLLVGRSTHTPEQLDAATREAVDYLAFGPVFGTRSKESEWSARGLAALERAVAVAAPLPLVAIGGIDAANAGAVAATGAGVAVISAVAMADDATLATRCLTHAMRGARGTSS